MAERIGKYTVERTLGQGGFGKVYLAFDPDVGQPVAIKKLIAQGDPDLLKRFQMEIRVTASLRHKNIVTIFASGEEAGDPYLVMEFLEGLTLKQIIQQNRPLSLLDKVHIMTQVAEGLAYAHSKGVVHRDVKPENIMLLPDDTVKIMDFGIAVGPNRSVTVTQTGGIIGTPPYFAPEQLQGLKANEQTDIFSFGDVYYELLSGVHPFEEYKNDWRALQIAIMSYEPRAIGELVPGCPDALETLVHRTLAKDAELRYPRFEDIQLDSEAILVDLKHEGAAAILRQVASLSQSGDLKTALSKINQAFQLDPGNREVRRLREEINLRLQKAQVDKRVAQLLSSADQQMAERRYPEAVQTLESAAKLDPGNAQITARLEDARHKLDEYLQVNRLVAEARYQQQKGLLGEAGDRLQQALEIDPQHTEALRLSRRLQAEVERRRAEERRRETIRAVEEQVAAKRFPEALEILDAAEAKQSDPAFADLRAEVQRQQAEEARRQRAERFQLAVARTRETIEGEEFARARQMLQHLETNFSSDEGAPAILLGLRERLESLIAAEEIAGYSGRAHELLNEGSFQAALDVLSEARSKYPADAGLEQLQQSAEERYRAHLRSEAIASAIREANEKRNAGDRRGALESIAAARREIGEDPSLTALASELEVEIERGRYRAALDGLLKSARASIAAGRYAAAIDRLSRPSEFVAEPEVLALLDSARVAAALEEQRRVVDQALRKAAQLEKDGVFSEAVAAVEQGLARFPNDQGLSRAAERLRGLVDLENRRASIRSHISRRAWDQAGAALDEARSAFPAENFGDLAAEIQTGLYEDGWRELQTKVQRQIESKSLSQAEQELDAQATRKIYSGDPRWRTLLQEVGRRKEYEDALEQAEHKRAAARFSEAEALLTEIIAKGAPDDRAAQMRRAIQAQRSEAARQNAVARIAAEIREGLNHGDLASAEERLAAARTRYPGESAWDDLQSQCDTLRRQTEIDTAANEVRRLLAEDRLTEAADSLRGARARHPGEGVWAVLDTELDLRSGAAKAAEAVQRCLASEPPAHSVAEYLESRLANLRSAKTELDVARARYPDERQWDDLQAAIDARRSLLAAENAVAERFHRFLEEGRVENAQTELSAARAEYADEPLWNLFAGELARHEEIARFASDIENRIAARNPEAALSQWNAARAKYPDENAWPRLRGQIDELRTNLDREAKVQRAAQKIREQLDTGIGGSFASAEELLRSVETALDDARSLSPGEPVWQELAAAIRDRRAQLQSEAGAAVRACSALPALDRIASDLAAARQRFPGEPFWEALQLEIDQRHDLLERASIAAFEAGIKESLDRNDVVAAASRLSAARQAHPNAGAWQALEAEIAARAERLKREQAIASAERAIHAELNRVAQLSGRDADNVLELQWEAFQAANAALSSPQAAYPNAPQMVRLSAEIAGRRAEWEGQIAVAVSALKDKPSSEAVRRLAAQVRALRAKEQALPLWPRLEREISEVEERVRRGLEAAAAAEEVRRHLQTFDIAGASENLRVARTRWPESPDWGALELETQARQKERDDIRRRVATLLAEGHAGEAVDLIQSHYANAAAFSDLMERARQEVEAQRLREARHNAFARLLAVEHEIAAEKSRRARNRLGGEAQRIAAGYPNDEEITAIAQRIRFLLETAEPRKPFPWLAVGLAGAAALAALLAFVLLRKPPPPPPPPRPATVSFEVRTDPPGALVHVGGRSCQTPNCTFDLVPGSYTVDAQLNGYVGQQRTVRVDAATHAIELSLAPIPPPEAEKNPAAPSTGTLEVRAHIPDALVYVDGTARSRTDSSGSAVLELNAGNHSIQVTRNGYDSPAPQEVGIAAGVRKTVTVPLTIRAAKLELDGAPAGVTVSIGSAALGRTDGSAAFVFPPSITPGDQTLQIASGGASRAVPERFEAGLTKRLKWSDVAPASPPPPPKVTPEQQEMLDWDRVKTSSDISQLRAFLQSHPNGAHAPVAASRIADLTWAAVDQTKEDAVRQFVRDNPTNPHVAEAQKLIDQFDAHTKAEAKKAAAAKAAQEAAAAKAAQEAAARQQIMGVLTNLNTAIQLRRMTEIRTIWKDVSSGFVNSIRSAGSNLSFAATDQDIQFTGANQATVSCQLRSSDAQPQKFTFTFQYDGSAWKIASGHAN